VLGRDDTAMISSHVVSSTAARHVKPRVLIITPHRPSTSTSQSTYNNQDPNGTASSAAQAYANTDDVASGLRNHRISTQSYGSNKSRPFDESHDSGSYQYGIHSDVPLDMNGRMLSDSQSRHETSDDFIDRYDYSDSSSEQILGGHRGRVHRHHPVTPRDDTARQSITSASGEPMQRHAQHGQQHRVDRNSIGGVSYYTTQSSRFDDAATLDDVRRSTFITTRAQRNTAVSLVLVKNLPVIVRINGVLLSCTLCFLLRVSGLHVIP
jgi:hypothetical protein